MQRLTLSAVLAAALAFGAAAEARELRVAAGAPPVHTAYNPLYLTFMERLPQETGGRLTAQHLGTEVVTVGNMKAQLQSGVVEVGNLLPLFVPADLPNTALTGDFAFLGREPHVMAAAVTEYVVTCADCLAEFKRSGFVFLGAHASDVYVLLTTKPVRSEADLRGMRLRSGGAPFARWGEAMGAVPTQIPVSDMFEAISQGVVDGTMSSINDLVSYRLVDIIKHVTDIKLGTYHATSGFTVNAATWAQLSPEDRAGMARAANYANARGTQDWGYERAEIARARAREAGIEFIEPAESLVRMTAEWVERDLASIPDLARDRFGIADGAEKVARFRAIVDRWTAIVAETGLDPDAIAARVQAEVWDKVDWSSYGL